MAARPELAAHLDVSAVTDVRELSDGNLNLVFLLRDSAGGGLVLKQALPYVRVDPAWPMTPGRARHEALALRVHGELAPGAVPRLYGFDADRYVLAIEDLSDHVVWRTALNLGERHEGAAGPRPLRGPHRLRVVGARPDPLEQKRLLADAVNPELCRSPRTSCSPSRSSSTSTTSTSRSWRTTSALWPRTRWSAAASGARRSPSSQGPGAPARRSAHRVRPRASRPGGAPRSTRAFDSEFAAFYGPIGFDIGTLWANFVLAAARAPPSTTASQAGWLLGLLDEAWSAFEAELRGLWPRRHDPRMLDDASSRTSSTRSASTPRPSLRRGRDDATVVGFAKVSDLESLPEDLRVGAAPCGLAAARLLAHEPARRPHPRRLAAASARSWRAPRQGARPCSPRR